MVSTDSYWTLVSVMSGQERLFRDRLVNLQQGVGAYVPQRTSTRVSRRARRPVTTRHAAFPRYVFIHNPCFGPLDVALRGTHLDYTPLFMDGEWGRIPSPEIDRVRVMETSGLLNNMDNNQLQQLFTGALVTMNYGPMHGQQAKVTKFGGPGSNYVTVELHGKVVRVPLDFLRK